jgi:hypothetical protein
MLDEQQEAPAAEAQDAEDETGSQEPGASSDDAADGGEGVSSEVLAEIAGEPTVWDDGAPADAGPRQAAEERAQQAADAGAQAAAEDAGAGDAPAE